MCPTAPVSDGREEVTEVRVIHLLIDRVIVVVVFIAKPRPTSARILRLLTLCLGYSDQVFAVGLVSW